MNFCLENQLFFYSFLGKRRRQFLDYLHHAPLQAFLSPSHLVCTKKGALWLLPCLIDESTFFDLIEIIFLVVAIIVFFPICVLFT